MEGEAFPEKEFMVDPTRVEEFLLALGLAPEPGYRPVPGVPVPLGFLMYVSAYGPEEVHGSLGVDFKRALYGGSEFEVLVPVRVGDRLKVRPRVAGSYEKRGSSGLLRFWEVITDYVLADGRLAVRERSTVVVREEGR